MDEKGRIRWPAEFDDWGLPTLSRRGLFGVAAGGFIGASLPELQPWEIETTNRETQRIYRSGETIQTPATPVTIDKWGLVFNIASMEGYKMRLDGGHFVYSITPSNTLGTAEITE